MPLAAALILVVGAQLAVPDRHHAEELARAGRTTEALALFTRLVEINPSDIEARLWIARLDLRLGRVAEAESLFRAVLVEHPDDIDASIGLGMVLVRKGAPQEALEVLREVEPRAGNNADLFSTLARAYRRAGDYQHALDYFSRARSLAPDDRDTTNGYEATARVYGHWVGIEGFGQWVSPGTDIGGGRLDGDVRVHPRVHLEAGIRSQIGPDYSDAVGGAGVVWMTPHANTVLFRALGGAGNAALPNSDIAGEVDHYAGNLEIGGSVRRLSFADAAVAAFSPLFAWDDSNGRWRFDTRYTYSHSRFRATDQSRGDHSIMLRGTWQRWRRAALQGSYAYGIESFEDLTSDRLGALGATTVAGGLRIDTPSLMRITTTWEHQWRSNDTTVDRLTLSVVQVFP